MSRADIQALETRIAGLKELIARRKSQIGCQQHEGSFSDTSKHIAAAEQLLHDAAVDLITCRCHGGGWDPLDIVERMQAPVRVPVQLPAPAKPAITIGDATRARLSNLLADNPGNFLPRSKLQELLK